MTNVASMTGFARVECAPIRNERYRIEIRTVNGRSLDLKIRTPRELQGLEPLIRDWFQKRLSRGSCEIRIEKLQTVNASTTAPAAELNLSQAAHYYESLVRLQKTLGLTDPIQTRDLLTFSDLFTRGEPAGVDPAADALLWKGVEPELERVLALLVQQRHAEGSRLRALFETSITTLQAHLTKVRGLRDAWKPKARSKLEERIRSVFDLYPISQKEIQAVLEARIAQELALVLERTDVEEELERAAGHLDHLARVLKEGAGSIGKKLEFVLQELHREFNTLGNKAQDLSISEEIVNAKVLVDQLREQALNIE